MSYFTRPNGTDVVVVIDASFESVTVPLAQMATGRMVSVRRMDSSGFSATVQVVSGASLDGVVNGSTSIGGDGIVSFLAVDGGFESLRPSPRNYSVTSSEFAELSAVTAGEGAEAYVSTTGATYRSNGLSWVLTVAPAAIEATGAARSPAITNLYYPGLLVTQTRTLTPTLNTLYLSPCYTDVAISIDSLAINCGTGAANATERLGVFVAVDQSTPFGGGGALLAKDAGTVDCSTSGDKTVTFTAIQIPAKTWFFVGSCAQTAAATMTVEGNTGLRGWSPMGIVSGSATIAAQPNIGMSVPNVTGAFPAQTATLGVTNTGSGVSYRRSA